MKTQNKNLFYFILRITIFLKREGERERERENICSILQWNNVDKIYVKYTQVHHISAKIPSVGLRVFIF